MGLSQDLGAEGHPDAQGPLVLKTGLSQANVSADGFSALVRKKWY